MEFSLVIEYHILDKLLTSIYIHSPLLLPLVYTTLQLPTYLRNIVYIPQLLTYLRNNIYLPHRDLILYLNNDYHNGDMV